MWIVFFIMTVYSNMNYYCKMVKDLYNPGLISRNKTHTEYLCNHIPFQQPNQVQLLFLCLVLKFGHF